MDFSIILKPFALLLGFLYSVTDSYGLAIILFCLIFKLVLFPISIKGRKGMLDMSRLSDKQKELQQKYGKDKQKYMEEQQKLYAAENVKPSSGCLWSFLPLPLLIALYGVVSRPFTHLMQLNSDQVSQLTNFIKGSAGGRNSQLSIAQQVYTDFANVKASLPDVASQIEQAGGPINFDFFGINLSSIPDLMFFQKAGGLTWPHIGLFLVPVISAVLAFMSMKVNMGINKRIIGNETKQDSMNRQMLFMQPLISLWICFTLPAALGIYWIANSVFAILQEYCSIGILKTHVTKMKAEAERRALEQKEKIKEQKRITADLKKKKAEEAKRIKMERKVSTDGISESRVGIRAYARGRTFDAERYPVTEYHDPDDIIKEHKKAQKLAQAEKKLKEDKKKSKDTNEDLPKGMILNGDGQRSTIHEQQEDETSAQQTADHSIVNEEEKED